MKFKDDRPFATPEAAERKLLELANAVEADHAGRLSVAVINRQFRDAVGSYEESGNDPSGGLFVGGPELNKITAIQLNGQVSLRRPEATLRSSHEIQGPEITWQEAQTATRSRADVSWTKS
jgi:hypothetical protein